MTTNNSDESSAPGGTPQIRRCRVLFADDDEQFRLGLGKRLCKAGFQCDYAGSAAEAAELLRAREYDVLLSDIHMPGNVGLELIENIPFIKDGLPAILLTGRPSVETASRSVRLRVAAYLTKPPDFEELCLLLDTAAAESRDLRLLKDHRQRLQDWDREIERLQQLLQQGNTPDRQSAMQGYLRLTLRNLVVGLVEMENLLHQQGDKTGVNEAVEKQELMNAVRKTIGVLEKTRDHFKSKDLGELRKELESLVG